MHSFVPTCGVEAPRFSLGLFQGQDVRGKGYREDTKTNTMSILHMSSEHGRMQ
jgi:hypothetical protein